MAEIKIKGETERILEDGSKQVISTRADLAFKQLTTYANRLELSKLTTPKLKNDKGVYVNTKLYGLDSKMVVIKKGNGIGKVGLTDEHTLSKLNYTKTHAFNYNSKEWVKLNTPQDIFTVNRGVEKILQYTFPYQIKDGLVEHPTKDGTLTLHKVMELTIPKNYKECIRQVSEPLNQIVSNIGYNLQDKLIEAQDRLENSTTDIYLEKPQVLKNMGRLYAILEEYPNVLPLLPQYMIDQPLIKEAYIKGKEKEGIVDLANHNEYVEMYIKGDNYPLFEGISKNVKENAKSKEKFYSIVRNTLEEVGKKNITFEDIKAEYTIAKEKLEEMKQLPVWEVRDSVNGKLNENTLDANDIKEIYGDNVNIIKEDESNQKEKEEPKKEEIEMEEFPF